MMAVSTEYNIVVFQQIKSSLLSLPSPAFMTSSTDCDEPPTAKSQSQFTPLWLIQHFTYPANQQTIYHAFIEC
jgi:hypothetical protein